MTQKEKLIYLLKNASAAFDSLEDAEISKTEFISDYLLENGVIVPPCKVGETVYVIFSQFKNEISKCRVDEFLIQEDEMYAVVDIYYPNYIAKRNTSIPFWWFGRFAFPTIEEAEKVLKGYINEI